MKRLLNKKEKSHTIYAIYDESCDELVSVSLDYSLLEMQLQINEFDRSRFEIIEFDVRLV